MAFVADDLAAWLIGLLADAGRHRLTTLILGTDQDRELRRAAAVAVHRTAQQLCPSNDEQADNVALVISQMFGEPLPDMPTAGYRTLLEALQTGVVAQLTILDDASMTGTGQSSADVLGVPGTSLAEKLTVHLLQEIVLRGSQGGPLAPLATQLNHDMTHIQGERLESMMGQLINEAGKALGRAQPWPIIEGSSPLQATAFQERRGAKRRLEASLAPTGATTVLTQVLAGDGGIGKTQLAVEAYERAYTSGSNDLCLWVTATSSEAIVTGYARVMRRIDPYAALDSPISAAQRFMTWLRETKNTWFIVLDDVVDPGDVEGWWPSGQTGRTLATTRRRDASLSEQGRILIDLDVFEPAEAQGYLSSRLSAPGTRPDVLHGSGKLAEALGCLPLALSQACAVILDDAITCEQYWDRFIDRTRTLIDLFPVSVSLGQRTVSATWSLAIETADRMPPPGLSRPLAALMAVLDANGIPEKVILADAARTFTERHRTSRNRGSPQSIVLSQGQLTDVQRQRDALRALNRLSLIVHDAGDATRSVRMHALAQRATREAVGSDTLQLAYKAAADAIVQAWPTVERDSNLSNVLRQNAAILTGLAGETLWEPRAHPVLFRAGHSLEEAGLVNSALAYWQRSLSTSVRALGPRHPDTRAIRRELAYCQGQAGDAVGAVTALEDLLADVLDKVGSKHRETLAIRRDLAWWRGETRDPAGAVAAYEELLSDTLQTLGPDDPETLTMRYNLARWRGQAGGPEPAINELTALLKDCLRLVGPDAPLTLAVRHDLAWWLGESGDAVAAVSAFEALLPDRQRIMGPDHPYTLATRHDLAWWKWDAGDREGAKSDLEAVLADYLRTMGPKHPHSVAVYEDLEFLIAGGRHGETHGVMRDTHERVPGDLPGLDFLQPAVARGHVLLDDRNAQNGVP